MRGVLGLTVALLLGPAAVLAGDRPPTEGRADSASLEAAPLRREAAVPHVKPDLSGRTRVGTASFYAKKFTGRKMADGQRMDPDTDNAASKSLPLGTIAKVTNLKTGQSAEVTIKDRGPYVKGRIVDLSPATAREVGITGHSGVAKVAVTPIELPAPRTDVKPGATTTDQKSIQQPGGDKAR